MAWEGKGDVQVYGGIWEILSESECGLLLANVTSKFHVIGPRGFCQSIWVLTWDIR